MVSRLRSGRAYAYRALAAQSQLAAQRMRRLLDEEDNRRQVLVSFVSDLSPGGEDIYCVVAGVGVLGWLTVT